MPLIEIRDLVVDFDTGKRMVRALHGIDLALDRGEAVSQIEARARLRRKSEQSRKPHA